MFSKCLSEWKIVRFRARSLPVQCDRSVITLISKCNFKLKLLVPLFDAKPSLFMQTCEDLVRISEYDSCLCPWKYISCSNYIVISVTAWCCNALLQSQGPRLVVLNRALPVFRIVCGIILFLEILSLAFWFHKPLNGGSEICTA